MAQDWYKEFEKPADHCISCGVQIDSVQRHHSAIVAVEEKALRRDICNECWEKMDPAEYFSYWLARREIKEPEYKLSREEIGNMVLNLFNALQESKDPKYQTHLFVIAHLLMKQKTFKWLKTKHRQPKSILIFQNMRTQELIEIEEVELNDDGLVETKREIDSLMNTALLNLQSGRPITAIETDEEAGEENTDEENNIESEVSETESNETPSASTT